MGGLSRVWVGLIGLRVKTGHRSIRVIFKLVNRVMGQTGCRSNGSGQTGLTHFVMSTLLFNTLTLVDPCTAFLKKLARLTKFTLIIYIYIFRIIIIYINSNIAALVQYYSSKGKLNANNFFFFFFFFFSATCCYFVFIYYYFIVLPQFFFPLIFGNLVVTNFFFPLSFLATHFQQLGCHKSYYSPLQFWQLGCHNPFFSLFTPLEFQQLGWHNWFFPSEHFSFGPFINLGSRIRAEEISVTSLPKFNSFLTPISHHFSLLSHPFFVRILATGLPKFASLLNFPNNFK